ncbi:putative acetyl-CoA carboxylase [Alicycliphilus sp. B1]|nr:putative acetyl-CoA carboxylase [Alicycliphilus sp. B1]
MGERAAQLLGGDLLVRHGLDHLGAGHEHVARILDMKMKSVMAGEYTAPPAQGPMIMLICGSHAAGHDVALKHVGIAAERRHAFLDARGRPNR